MLLALVADWIVSYLCSYVHKDVSCSWCVGRRSNSHLSTSQYRQHYQTQWHTISATVSRNNKVYFLHVLLYCMYYISFCFFFPGELVTISQWPSNSLRYCGEAEAVQCICHRLVMKGHITVLNHHHWDFSLLHSLLKCCWCWHAAVFCLWRDSGMWLNEKLEEKCSLHTCIQTVFNPFCKCIE